MIMTLILLFVPLEWHCNVQLHNIYFYMFLLTFTPATIGPMHMCQCELVDEKLTGAKLVIKLQEAMQTKTCAQQDPNAMPGVKFLTFWQAEG